MWNLYDNNIALIDDRGNSLTYRQLYNAKKDFLKKVKKRRLIFLVCENSIDCIVVYVACLLNKIPLLLISKNIMDDEIELLIRCYKPAYIYKESELIKTAYQMDYPMDEQLALLLSTSGSTGNCKYVKISYDNILENTKAIVDVLEMKSSDRVVTSLPLNYCYGLSVINTHLFVGATICVTDEKIISGKFWEFVKKSRVTTFAGVPYTYELLRKLNIFSRKDIKLRRMLQAGGKISFEMEQFLRRYAMDNGIELYLMYGQTEATARMSVMRADNKERIGSVGRALPGGRLEISAFIDSKKNIEKIGEIIYYGPNVSLGYATSIEELSNGDKNKGVLKTGDVGYLDEEGYLYVVGRKDKIVKINGIRIDLECIEQRMNEEFGCKYIVYYEEGVLHICAKKIIGCEDEFVAKLIGINKRIVKIKKMIFMK